jgi:prolipoprotein diacylglyceryltransferase
MLQTLFYIPDQLGSLRVFGFGLLFGIWALVAVAVLWRMVYQQGFTADVLGTMAMMAVVGAAICFFLPGLVVTDPETGKPLGLPIRGYGVMVLLGVVAGVWLAVHRAKKRGIDVELIFRLALWLFVGGVIGARFFYVFEYWDRQFYKPGDFQATLKAVLSIWQGGLVIYGALIGAGVAALLFWLWHRDQPMLKIADVIAPSMALGLGIGRIGCFLNGCCFGGVSDVPWAVTFPEDSPPYMRQLGDSRRLIEVPANRVQTAEDNVSAADQRVNDADPADAASVKKAQEQLKQAKADLDEAKRKQSKSEPLYLHGIALTSGLTPLPIDRSNESDKIGVYVAAVQPDSDAAKAGLQSGEQIIEIHEQPGGDAAADRQVFPRKDEHEGQPADKEGDSTLGAAERALLAIKGEGTKIVLFTINAEDREKDRDKPVSWAITKPDIPVRSLPVQPTQLYSAIDAVLLCLLLLAFDPFRRRDGEVLALMLTVHPISRFLLESIRTDEPKKYPLPFTTEHASISQLVSLVLLVAAIGLWCYIFLRKPRLDGSDLEYTEEYSEEEPMAEEMDVPPASE